jgi:hypothetical protein
MIEVLKNSVIKANIKWSGYRAAFRYILAPENGSAGTVNVGDWEQIWQYGSNLGQCIIHEDSELKCTNIRTRSVEIFKRIAWNGYCIRPVGVNKKLLFLNNK